MALKGMFRKQLAVLPDGVLRNIYSLVLHNTDWLGQQEITIVFSGMGDVQKASFDIKLKAGKSIELDVRNTGWDWSVGDFAMIVDKKGREKMRWNIEKHRMLLRTAASQICNGQPIKELFPALEPGRNGREQERFAKAARTAQEIIAARINKSCYLRGFIHIYIAAFADLLKVLNANRIFHGEPP